MPDQTVLKYGEQPGLRFACVLDGRGGCRELDWPGVEAWKPEDGVLWVHLERDSPDARSPSTSKRTARKPPSRSTNEKRSSRPVSVAPRTGCGTPATTIVPPTFWNCCASWIVATSLPAPSAMRQRPATVAGTIHR